MNETHLDFRLWGLWLHGAAPCGGPCDARNAVNGEEEAPNQPTPVNLPPDRTLMGQLWFLGTTLSLVAKVLDELDSWRLRWALWAWWAWWAWWGWERESSVRFHFLHCLFTPNHRPLCHSRQRQRRGILAACPRSPYALLGTTIECYDSESSPFYPVRVENDDEAMKPGAREPGQCPGGEDPASKETLVQPPRILASEGHFGL